MRLDFKIVASTATISRAFRPPKDLLTCRQDASATLKILRSPPQNDFFNTIDLKTSSAIGDSIKRDDRAPGDEIPVLRVKRMSELFTRRFLDPCCKRRLAVHQSMKIKGV
jgi:hypothetical protein